MGCEEWGAAGDGNGGNVFGDGRELLMCCSSRCPKMVCLGAGGSGEFIFGWGVVK